jgi:hypothetical protein
MAYVSVDVDVDLTDFDTDDLIEELESRGSLLGSDTKKLLEDLYLKRRLGQDYQTELDQLIYAGLGKIL